MSSSHYMIVVLDTTSDNCTYGVYQDEDGATKAYRSLEDAKAGLSSIADSYEQFLFTAYGKAFPYDMTTFEEELEDKGFAPWGWGIVADEEDEDVVQKICIGLISISVE